MTIKWNQFIMDGTVTTEGGQTISLMGDKAGSDYSVLTVSDLNLKLNQTDLQEIMQLINREGFARNSVR